LITFPDFFDFTGGMCFDANYQDSCLWAKQYYGRTIQSTNDVWIAFQETANPGSGGTMNYAGWTRDWEYGLILTTPKGETIWRQRTTSSDDELPDKPGLKEIFNQEVADAYNGQARKVGLNETMILEPKAEWKGITDAAPRYELDIIFIDNSGRAKIEVGSQADGWNVFDWNRTGQNNWQTKAFTIDKKARQIKITPLSGDPLYLHFVKLSLK